MYIFAKLLCALPFNRFPSEKRNGSFRYRAFVLGVHATIVFFTALLLLVDLLNCKAVLCVLIFAVAHFLIDTLRVTTERRVYVRVASYLVRFR